MCSSVSLASHQARFPAVLCARVPCPTPVGRRLNSQTPKMAGNRAQLFTGESKVTCQAPGPLPHILLGDLLSFRSSGWRRFPQPLSKYRYLSRVPALGPLHWHLTPCPFAFKPNPAKPHLRSLRGLILVPRAHDPSIPCYRPQGSWALGTRMGRTAQVAQSRRTSAGPEFYEDSDRRFLQDRLDVSCFCRKRTILVVSNWTILSSD